MCLVTHWDSVLVAVFVPIQALTFQNGLEEIEWPGLGTESQIIYVMRIMPIFGVVVIDIGMISMILEQNI